MGERSYEADRLLDLAGRHDLDCLEEAWEEATDLANAFDRQAAEIERLRATVARVEAAVAHDEWRYTIEGLRDDDFRGPAYAARRVESLRRRIRVALDGDDDAETGTCPVCGEHPQVAGDVCDVCYGEPRCSAPCRRCDKA